VCEIYRSSTVFICQLSKDKQEKIKELVSEYCKKEGFDDKKIQDILDNVMDDRLLNIENIIDIKQFLE